MIEFRIAGSAEIKPDYKSKGVMVFTHADISHVLVIFRRGPELPWMIIDSTGDGVTEHPLDKFLETHKLIYDIDITKYVTRPCCAIAWLEGNFGKDYSEGQYFGFVFDFLKGFVRDGESELICSELVPRFIDKWTTLTCFKGADFDFINPKEAIKTLMEAVA